MQIKTTQNMLDITQRPFDSTLVELSPLFDASKTLKIDLKGRMIKTPSCNIGLDLHLNQNQAIKQNLELWENDINIGYDSLNFYPSAPTKESSSKQNFQSVD